MASSSGVLHTPPPGPLGQGTDNLISWNKKRETTCGWKEFFFLNPFVKAFFFYSLRKKATKLFVSWLFLNTHVFKWVNYIFLGFRSDRNKFLLSPFELLEIPCFAQHLSPLYHRDNFFSTQLEFSYPCGASRVFSSLLLLFSLIFKKDFLILGDPPKATNPSFMF